MRVRLRLLQSLLLAASLGTASPAQAAVTIQAVSPYTKASGDIIRYAADDVDVDTGANFHAFNLAATTGANDLIYLDVSTSRAFSVNPGQDVVVTLIAQDKTSSPIPIARAGLVGAVADCSGSSNCQGPITIGGEALYAAAKYPASPPGQVLRIGFYPKRICEAIGTVTGVCDGANVEDPASEDPVVFSLKVYIGVEKADGDVGTISDTEERGSVSLSFQYDWPEAVPASCPQLSTAYFPGDREISFNPSPFSAAFTVTSGAAPVDALVVLAKNGAAPGGLDAAGQVTARVSSGSPSTIEGFSNTTNGTDNLYYVEVFARDQAGALSSDACPTGTMLNYKIQTASIQGLLTKSQCFIATAAFRSAKDPAVVLLRRFRDEVLLTNALGRTFVEGYYRWSPRAAALVLERPELRVPVLIALAPIQLWAWLTLHSKWILAVLIFGALLAFPRALRRFSLMVAVLLAGLSAGHSAFADEDSMDESIIEEIRRESPALREDEQGSVEPYLRSQKAKLKAEEEDESLIETIRGEQAPESGDEKNYTDRKKRELRLEEAEVGAIEKFRAGRSKLVARKAERTGNAFGITVSMKQTRQVRADSAAVYRTFDSMYAEDHSPDIQLFYETQPFHGEWLGSIGLFAQLGISWGTAKGSFQVTPAHPDGGSFSTTATTKFTFVELPATVGGIYRFNLLRFARPYVKAGATLLGYAEDRSDNRGTTWGNSRAYIVGAGVAFPIDFLDSVGSWSLYEAHGVRRHCLTVDYQRLRTLSGALNFSVSLVSVGFLFEL